MASSLCSPELGRENTWCFNTKALAVVTCSMRWLPAEEDLFYVVNVVSVQQPHARAKLLQYVAEVLDMSTTPPSLNTYCFHYN